IRRERMRERARREPRAERVLRVGDGRGSRSRSPGPRLASLVAAVAAAGTLRYADARLAGYSAALIARALRVGALHEERQAPAPVTPLAGEAHDFTPTDEQARAIAALEAALEQGSFAEFLLQGITGSGKTFVYIRAIARALARGARAVVLVPEIALTPQTAHRFESVFGARVAVLHSGLSERERIAAWYAASSGAIDVVVGARSAVFAPLRNLRLIVVDEAHERTYKQENAPRYHAVEIARERMRRSGGALVLGSATPPLEAYAAAREGRIAHLRLERRATRQPLPRVEIVDLAVEFERGNRRIFSARLVDALATRLERGEQSILFVNRRGSARFALCRSCGTVPHCERCSSALAVHREEGLLRCHLCDRRRPLPERCPHCGSTAFREFGAGTERVVAEVAALFPRARVVRLDSDAATRVGDHARILARFESDGDVLVGTQMIAKGLDLPRVTLVGVVAADIGLHAPDFRAAERTFDLIAQVAGRSGRGAPGEAIVQTYAPKHPAIALAARHDVDGFARGELVERRALGYPPYGELIEIGIVGRERAVVAARAELYAALARERGEGTVLGPAPMPIPRVAAEWRYRFVFKLPDADAASRTRAWIAATLAPRARNERTTRLVVNVDP
ncbi:MAG: replication restart helicase PriA, partial [Vulcanimicrobiaceae bacterium]